MLAPTKLPKSDRAPGFGFVLMGGALVGAAVRDLRIANELAERGYPVHIYWALDKTPVLKLHPSIRQHWLFNAARYNGWTVNLLRLKYLAADDYVGMAICNMTPLKLKLRIYQHGLFGINFAAWAMRGTIRHICRGVEIDRGQLKRFARSLTKNKVTHLMPSLSLYAPFCHGAKQYMPDPAKYLVTYQGYELYANYARELGCLDQFYSRLRETAELSDYQAVTVSDDYKERVQEDLGVPGDRITVVPACAPLPAPLPLESARATLLQHFPEYRPELPLISYVGRQDSEKGIDLLLYSAKILAARGYRFQVAVAGATACGTTYRDAVRQIAEHLRLPVLFADYLKEETRTALYRASHCVVYPSIHREPFGMVPIEAMALGTPVVVPDTGGVATLPFADGLQGGLNFKSWDSGDLAERLAQLLDRPELHRDFQVDAPQIAARYSVERVTDQLLDLLGISTEASIPGSRISEPALEPSALA